MSKWKIRISVGNKGLLILTKQSGSLKVVLFGSRAKGNFKAGSDIDIALFGDSLKVNDLLVLASDLDNLWLPNKFDLVIFDHIKEQSLIDHIERVGVSLWERQDQKTQ